MSKRMSGTFGNGVYVPANMSSGDMSGPPKDGCRSNGPTGSFRAFLSLAVVGSSVDSVATKGCGWAVEATAMAFRKE